MSTRTQADGHAEVQFDESSVPKSPDGSLIIAERNMQQAIHHQAEHLLTEDLNSAQADWRERGHHSALQAKTWESVRPQHALLLTLDPEKPEAVFGPDYRESFLPESALESGEAPVCVCCMDERAPSPEGGMKLGVAGAGVLMTAIPSFGWLRDATLTDIYRYLSDVESGDDNFRAFVAKIPDTPEARRAMSVADHEGCGAVGIFCGALEHALQVAGNPLKLSRPRVGREAAKRLHRALGLAGAPRAALHPRPGGYSAEALKDIPLEDRATHVIHMNESPDIHDGYALVIDLTGRNDGSLRVGGKPLRALWLSARYSPDWAYLGAEVQAGRGILKGASGVGIDPPILFIGSPEEIAGAREKLGDALKDATVLTLHTPA